ncbi:ABC transporter ATP-binding protein/permease [Corynebacterium liangguodongii]|uniref:ABC transporter ATP-binding protein/permease n=1 Tax=Corynebacterium liangguodongii TaxID=2079535 RepID=UPI001304AC91|nr:ABC transporter ATP-binding protein/permease [Corynebacterium liangguodongii]
MLQLAQPLLLSGLVAFDSNERNKAAVLFMAAVVCQLGLTVAIQGLNQVIQLRRVTDLREELFLKISHAEVGTELEEMKRVYPVVTASEVPAAIGGIIRPVLEGAKNVTIILGVAIYFVHLNVLLVVIASLLLTAGCMSVVLGLKSVRRKSENAVAANQRFVSFQYGYIDCYDEARSRLFLSGGVRESNLFKSIKTVQSSGLRLLCSKLKFGSPADLLFGATAPTMACLSAVVLYPNGDMALNQIVEVFLFSSLVVTPVQSIAGASFSWQYTSALIQRIYRLQCIPQEASEPMESHTVGALDCSLVGDLEMRDSPKGRVILSRIKFRIPSRGLVVVTGRSGAGKTTLGRIIAGLEAPSWGRIRDSKGRTLSPEELRSRFSYSAQSPNFAEGLRGVERDLDDGLLHGALTALDVSNLLGRTGNSSFFRGVFSGGEAKRLSVVGALAQNTVGIVLDEPTNGLNDLLVEQLVSYLQVNRFSKLWVVITHDVRVVNIADHVIKMQE